MTFTKDSLAAGSIKGWMEENKKQIFFCFAVVFAWGLMAHGYMFFNNIPSHDALNEFYATVAKDNWKIELGRFIVPLYRDIFRGKLTAPWLIGFLSLIYISLALFLTSRMFRLNSRLTVILVGGVMATNPTLIAEYASYMHDTDVNMLALLCAIFTAYLWQQKKGIVAFIAGAVSLVVSLGIYQSYISLTITFIILASILDLLDGKDEKDVLVKGFKGIAVIVAGCILYWLLYALCFSIMGIVPNERTNAFSFSDKTTNVPLYILQLIFNAYYHFKEYITEDRNMLYFEWLLPAIAVIIAVVAVITAVYVLKNKDYSWLKKGMIGVLAALMPLAMNITYVTSKGSGIHDLMHYAIWFVYAVLLIILDRVLVKKQFSLSRVIKTASCVLVAVMLWQNVVTANTAYLKKDIEFNSELSLMTRVAYRMELVEGYVPGETPVMFKGMSDMYSTIPGTEDVAKLIGLDYMSPIAMDARYNEYFTYVLNYPIKDATDEQRMMVRYTEEYDQLKAYPDKDCMKIIEGVLVVKMG